MQIYSAVIDLALLHEGAFPTVTGSIEQSSQSATQDVSADVVLSGAVAQSSQSATQDLAGSHTAASTAAYYQNTLKKNSRIQYPGRAKMKEIEQRSKRAPARRWIVVRVN